MLLECLSVVYNPQQRRGAEWYQHASEEAPASLHQQNLSLEACRGPLRWLQSTISDSGHVVLGPWLIAQVVDQSHFLKHMQAAHNDNVMPSTAG